MGFVIKLGALHDGKKKMIKKEEKKTFNLNIP